MPSRRARVPRRSARPSTTRTPAHIPSPAASRPGPTRSREAVGGRPAAQRDRQVIGLLRVAGQERRRQDRRPGPAAGRPDRPAGAGPRPRKPRDTRTPPRRADSAPRTPEPGRKANTGRTRPRPGSPRAHAQRPGQPVRPEPGPEEVADGDPAQGRGDPGPPGQPGRRVEEAGLGIADQGPTAEAPVVPEREPAEPGDRAGDRQVMGEEEAGQVVAGRASSTGRAGQRSGGRRRRSGPRGRPRARQSQPAAAPEGRPETPVRRLIMSERGSSRASCVHELRLVP